MIIIQFYILGYISRFSIQHKHINRSSFTPTRPIVFSILSRFIILCQYINTNILH